MAHSSEWHHLQADTGSADTIERCRRTLEANPDDIVARTSLAGALFNSGYRDVAFAEVNEAVRRSPGNSAPYIALGAMLGAAGKIEEAVAVERKAVALDPNNPSMHWSLAMALNKNNQRNEARACWERVIALCEKAEGGASVEGQVTDTRWLAGPAREMLKLYPEE